MVKTSSTLVKTTQKLVVPPPPFRMSKPCPAPPLILGVRLHLLPTSRFVAPSPLHVIDDHSHIYFNHTNLKSLKKAFYQMYTRNTMFELLVSFCLQGVDVIAALVSERLLPAVSDHVPQQPVGLHPLLRPLQVTTDPAGNHALGRLRHNTPGGATHPTLLLTRGRHHGRT